jgi:predicted HicB family RNase H-like nuclease
MGKGTKTRSVGRPELPKGHAMGKIVPVRFKPDEFKAISKAAKARKLSVSEWIRGTLNAKLSEQKAA